MRFPVIITTKYGVLFVTCQSCGQRVAAEIAGDTMRLAVHQMPPQPPVGAKAEFGTGDACPDGGRVLGRVGVAA